MKLRVVPVALAWLASVAVYPWLPERVPVHFGLAGQPDGWGPRPLGAFLLPAIALAVLALARVARGAKLVTTILAWFFLGLQVLLLRAALFGGGLGGGLWLLMGTSFVAIGLALPRVRQNRWAGVRTPWANRSPEIWARTQRVGGASMVAGGIVLILSAGASDLGVMALRLFALLASSLVPIVYSWWASRTLLSS